MALIIDAQNLIITVSDGEEIPDYKTIGQVVSFQGVDGEAPDIDVTHFGSEGYKEYLIGLANDGPFNMNMIWDSQDEGQAELLDMSEARETRELIVTFLSGHTLTFNAYVKSLSHGSGSVDSRIDRVCNMMITGEAVLAAPEE